VKWLALFGLLWRREYESHKANGRLRWRCRARVAGVVIFFLFFLFLDSLLFVLSFLLCFAFFLLGSS
jgi:hypothetical protein